MTFSVFPGARLESIALWTWPLGKTSVGTHWIKNQDRHHGSMELLHAAVSGYLIKTTKHVKNLFEVHWDKSLAPTTPLFRSSAQMMATCWGRFAESDWNSLSDVVWYDTSDT